MTQFDPKKIFAYNKESKIKVEAKSKLKFNFGFAIFELTRLFVFKPAF